MKNPLKEWQDKWFAEMKKIVLNLLKENMTFEEIVEYFRFDNFVKKHRDLCPLEKPCHNLDEKNHYCFFCACPFFDAEYWNEEKKEYGRCLISSKFGKRLDNGYWDCSECFIPHTKTFTKIHLKEFLKKLL